MHKANMPKMLRKGQKSCCSIIIKLFPHLKCSFTKKEDND